jgi:hypothetical protein
VSSNIFNAMNSDKESKCKGWHFGHVSWIEFQLIRLIGRGSENRLLVIAVRNRPVNVPVSGTITAKWPKTHNCPNIRGISIGWGYDVSVPSPNRQAHAKAKRHAQKRCHALIGLKRGAPRPLRRMSFPPKHLGRRGCQLKLRSLRRRISTCHITAAFVK